MKRITAQQAESDLEKVIEEAAAAHEPVGIDGTHAHGVLVALADWNAIQETLYLLSVPGMRESIREGEAEPLDACSEVLDW
jgi:PHD/YefM family antitoxin component YafN of YafNO toxin-antitoxin module